MILVTGGNGLLGLHLIHALLSEEREVRASYRSEEKLQEARRIFEELQDGSDRWSKVDWKMADLTDIFAVDALLDGVHEVYHCAATVSMDPRDDTRMYLNNTQITENIVNSCLERDRIRLVHVSSVASMGESKEGQLISEETIWNDPKSKGAYARSKYACEQIVWRATEEGLDAAIVNPSIILGPANWSTGSAQLFKKIHSGFSMYTDAMQGVVDARDVAEAMIRLMDSDIRSKRFLISGHNIHLKVLMGMIATALGVKAPWLRIRPWMGEIAWRLVAIVSFLTRARPVITRDMVRSGSENHRYDNTRSIEELGMHYRPLSDTVKYTAEVYLSLEG